MMADHDISTLIEVSRRYGADARMVLLGGGNTSWKTDSVMYVKASGHALGTIGRDGFVAMSMDRLQAIWDKQYPTVPEQREKQILEDMMESRCAGESGRPSVEALLHALIPFDYVVHLHPAIVNGLTCGQSGEESMHRLFPDAIWIPLVNPGYILAKKVKDVMAAYLESHDAPPAMIFLQNHGVFVGSDTIEGIDASYDQIMETLAKSLVRKPIFGEVKVDAKRVALVQQAMRSHFKASTDFPIVANREVMNRLADASSFASVSSAYTPDHIVYSGFKPLWVSEEVFGAADPVAAIIASLHQFEQDYQVPAKVVAIQDTAVFATSEAALLLFLDTVKVAVFTESFGGPRFMDDDQIEFIRGWEVERYRSKMSG